MTTLAFRIATVPARSRKSIVWLIMPLLWLPAIQFIGFADVAFAQSTVVLQATAGMAPGVVSKGQAKLISHLNGEQKLRLVIGLQPPHMDEEEQFLRDLQDPKSPLFHHYLSADEWNARFSPTVADEQAVLDWAKGAGLAVTYRYPNRLLVDLEGTSSVIEKALNVTINNYQLGSTSFFSNDRAAAIPATLGSIVQSLLGLNSYEAVHPGTNVANGPSFPIYSPGPAWSRGQSGKADGDRSKKPAERAQSGVDPFITFGSYDPRDLYSSNAYDANALYAQGLCCNPFGNPNNSPPETSIAIATVGSQNPNDFAGFHNTFPYLAYYYQQINVDGTPPCCDVEGTLDFEWATAMSNSFGSAANTSKIYMYNGVNTMISTLTDVYNHILTDGYARVFSTSYGAAENVYLASRITTDHNIFNQMLGQGWTLVGIAHDHGATDDCATISVDYPGSDPDLISSGGTLLSLDHTNGSYLTEVTWTGDTDSLACTQKRGGTGGGCSTLFSAPSYQTLYQSSPACGTGSRSVPDLALNASTHEPQIAYFNGGLVDVTGTSIVAPELAGFFAQENAYLLYLNSIVGSCNGAPCAPLGQPHAALYYIGAFDPHYAAHFPFYDITSGCNSNNVTIANGLTAFCAQSGYDRATGWGSINMLQLAWAINSFLARDFGLPYTVVQTPTLGKWYNTDQTVFWVAYDTANYGHPAVDIAGTTGKWDKDPGNIFSHATPGTGDSFYTGPAKPQQSGGSLNLSAGGQGCHTFHVRAWDNTGFESADNAYGPMCYDTIAPETSITLTGPSTNGIYTGPVQVTLTASDASPGSGVAGTSYRINNGNVWFLYTGPFTLSATGSYTVSFYSTDNATNTEAVRNATFSIKGLTSTTLATSLTTSSYHQKVTFTATVKASYGGTATGTVTFKDGTTSMGTVTLSSGQAIFSTVNMVPGIHSIVAVFNTNAHFLGSKSAAVSVTVNKAATTTQLASSLNPSTHGTAVTFTATVKGAFGGAPAGTVTFRDGTTTLGSASINTSTHQAIFTISTLSVGTHSITAHYGGNADFKASTSAVLSQVVQ